ncbi:hypothetical protein SORBI_3007G027500 [Sorghum bicolor]|uniref:BTB domain-containing protein n=2 Tax=Sorghum bicolor TaxID=4558 RepID=A0A1B6PF91_SORBI|nr:hypothetical protein SORBI_3007G027500 [Sorghum bicolor]
MPHHLPVVVVPVEIAGEQQHVGVDEVKQSSKDHRLHVVDGDAIHGLLLHIPEELRHEHRRPRSQHHPVRAEDLSLDGERDVRRLVAMLLVQQQLAQVLGQVRRRQSEFAQSYGLWHPRLVGDDVDDALDLIMNTNNTSAQEVLGEKMALPANTKSTNTTETVRGEHRFDIDGYSGKLRAGRVVTSETFAVGGLDWAIRYHPAAAEVGDEEYVSVFVKLVTPNARAWALYDLRLVDRATGLPRSVRRRREPVAFDASKARKRERGSRLFMTVSELAASPYLRDDRLTVECVLDVVETFLSETTASPGTAEPPPPDLSRHLGALLLQTPVGADVSFAVQGETFRAHRVVLAARSPVLKAELSGSAPAKEDDDDDASEVVAVDGMAPPVFKTLLHFVYTDTLPEDLLGDLGREEQQEFVRDLLAGADRYGMDRLKKICELVLRKPLDAKTVAAALDQHRHCQCQALGDGNVQFMPSA